MLEDEKANATDTVREGSSNDRPEVGRLRHSLADILLPARPPKPKQARVVLGAFSLKDSFITASPRPRSAVAGREGLSVNAAPAVTARSTLQDMATSPSTPIVRRRNRRDRASRNRSLLAAAGLE
jgi:hypothetical protein